TLDPDMRTQLHQRLREVVKHSAMVMGAQTQLELPYTTRYPITYNEPQLMQQMLPTMQRVAGTDNVKLMNAITGAEDFSFFQQQVPGVYFFLGGKNPQTPVEQAPAHHTPGFYIDESGLKLGVETLYHLAVDYLQQAQ
ncbi:MAG: M20/M25/M40 family metallo-hydrolase, partial [Gammaproteobacteria bacterium]|nr:M20/M25/M40 family metallo-hydrolase [Gammaproteobacteria bacterium]